MLRLALLNYGGMKTVKDCLGSCPEGYYSSEGEGDDWRRGWSSSIAQSNYKLQKIAGQYIDR